VPTTGKYAENPAYFTFNSDTVNNYELGFKGTTSLFSYSLSAYYQDWKDPQLNTATSNWGFFAVINGKSASTRGIELELSGKLADSLSYTFGYTYTDAKLTADVYQPAGNFYGSGVLYNDLIATDGERLPGTAQTILSASLTHRMSLPHDMALTTVVSGYYQSSTLNSLGNNDCLTSYNAIGNCRDSANPASAYYAPTSVFSRAYANIDSFQIWNVSTTLNKDHWDASLYAKNVFNQAGTTGTFPFLLGGSQTDPSQNYYGNNSRNYIAQPRTIGVVLAYKF
jgi:outer membrane receptor protein involved in Fe transport